MNDNDVFIVSLARTPIGNLGGALKGVRASSLMALVMKAVIGKLEAFDAGDIDDVVVGDCIQCFDEANTARTSALIAGIPFTVPAVTIQRQCASSMQALNVGALEIRAGDADVVLVGGVESMSSAPYYIGDARWGLRLMNHELTDSVWEMLHSGSRILGDPMIMGITAENLAEKYSISRGDQDELALESHHKAEDAIKSGRFTSEVVPVDVSSASEYGGIFSQDEHPRSGLTMDALARLRPVFKRDGTVTAGNSSGLNDGAAAVILMSGRKVKEKGLEPVVRVVACTAAGVEPELMGYGPVPSTRAIMKKTGTQMSDFDLIELNEAFAAQYLACERALGLDRSITNVNGSGIGLGHPVGCTGIRIVISLACEMARRDAELGLATLCVGGGMGMSTVIDREW